MARTSHSLGFQALNQARKATHAKQFFEGYKGLIVTDPRLGAAFHAYGDFFSTARKAMREMCVLNVASVMDKQSTSTGMISLLEEVSNAGAISSDDLERLSMDLLAHESSFRKATILRSNIIAHRSKQLTYKQTHELADLADPDLASAIEAWRLVAQELSRQLRGETWDVVSDPGGAAARLIADIAREMRLGE